MTRMKAALCAGAVLGLAAAIAAPLLLAAGASAQDAAAAEPPFSREGAPVTWEHPAYASAQEQYETRRAAAENPGDLDRADVPDWSGLWEQAPFQGFFFSLRPGEPFAGRGFASVTTMQLTPRYAAEREARIRRAEIGEDFDPLSFCLPAGFPRWFTEPFMREFHPQPGMTLLINEMQNEIRHIHTDGRGHISEDFAYPLWEGDSIGFWDDQTLVIWTDHIKANLLQREQPAFSDQAQVYEEWTKVADDVIRVKATLYDPEALTAPHDFIRYYTKVDDQGGELRLAYWSCEENQPVIRTAGGGTDFGVLPGDEAAVDLNDAETWLMFEEAADSGLLAEYEGAATAGAPLPVNIPPAARAPSGDDVEE